MEEGGRGRRRKRKGEGMYNATHAPTASEVELLCLTQK